ncbi:endolytic transglycosylase MltG [Microbacterium telephonicum]|uniref:Endolytic murein transglycosylase n=1 Tax=Microbacterium telephonicum TaxID=1714841 RepID=A0A498CA72_9MICO|nr:endolytic transglycosylase MltG [Microbacterium telephonicum]RLK49181.1 UPF0755 protein [Microbacterium telephonicum]
MPDQPSNDDQFADLFSKLPSARGAEQPRAEAPRASQPEPAAPRRDAETDAAAPAPGSRRAAREAAAATGPHAVDGDTGRPSAAASAAPTPPAQPVVAPRATSAPAAEEPRAVWATPGAEAGGAGTIDALFGADQHEDRLSRQKRHDADKRKSRIAKWVVLGVVLAIIGGIVGGGFYVWNTYEPQIRKVMGWEEPRDYVDGEATGEVTVTIADGDIPSTISQTLFDAGVTKTPTAFYQHLVDEGLEPTFYPGAYRLQQKMTSAAALAALEDPANKLENTAQLREGLTVAGSLPILADATGIAVEDFQAAVADPSVYGVPVDQAVVAAGGQPLEGWLFPATYTFDPGVTAQQVIQTLVDRTVRSLDTAGVPVEQRQQVLTTASIIQREARLEEDFYKVSRVIANRLADGMKLQMDSTAQYGYGEMHDGTVSSSAEALEDDNPWNTYVVDGLPVGPISNPGDTAIDAAMHPADGDWLYFVTWNMDTGETIFSATYEEHQQGIAQWDQWCADNDNRGC